MEKSGMVFHVFTKENCRACQMEMPRLMRILKNRGYKVIEHSIDNLDGLSEFSMRGLESVPAIVGEIEGTV